MAFEPEACFCDLGPGWGCDLHGVPTADDPTPRRTYGPHAPEGLDGLTRQDEALDRALLESLPAPRALTRPESD